MKHPFKIPHNILLHQLLLRTDSPHIRHRTHLQQRSPFPIPLVKRPVHIQNRLNIPRLNAARHRQLHCRIRPGNRLARPVSPGKKHHVKSVPHIPLKLGLLRQRIKKLPGIPLLKPLVILHQLQHLFFYHFNCHDLAVLTILKNLLAP